jgi:S-adenosyl-L-methionine hydrolase (adenosine-forming)
MAIITLTTDFGLSDGYVGTMKGVILSIASDARLVDISHDITPPSCEDLRQNIRQAAYVLHAAAPYFPQGTIHLAVVDPGVGSARRALAIRTAHGFLVGPDNGLFTLFLAEQPNAECHAITNAKYTLPRVSATFHGRDIFAPVAAHLANGADPADLGPRITDPVTFSIPTPTQQPDRSWLGCVLYADHFGNLITSVTDDHLQTITDAGRKPVEISVGQRCIAGIRRTYSDVEPGELVALVGSSGHLEISVAGGNAVQTLGLGPDAPVILRTAG